MQLSHAVLHRPPVSRWRLTESVVDTLVYFLGKNRSRSAGPTSYPVSGMALSKDKGAPHSLLFVSIRTVMSLSPIPNILDDATDALDDEVNEVIYPFLAENPQIGNYSNVAYMFLFQATVEFSNATPLDPKLIALLGAAWKGRSYHDIQNLFSLISHSPDIPSIGIYLDSDKIIAHRSDGGPLEYYAKFCAVVQTSGSENHTCCMKRIFCHTFHGTIMIY
ncbi:hypothetical protein EDD15DRAFT_551129 [Pisolithus albus]|nr:hypothetical protein EDD15DRAFT_551129 [Pisolithus albus]